MVVGLFWWALLNSSPTHTSVASGMLLSYSVIGAILSMIGLILLIGWYSSGNTDPEENPLD